MNQANMQSGKKKKAPNKANKRSRWPKDLPTIDFEKCYRYESECPFKDCADYKKKVYKSPQEFHQHIKLKHGTREKYRNLKVWKCPESSCGKPCSSFYNFSAHVAAHRDLCDPALICLLSRATSSKYANMLHPTQTKSSICGKRASTKNNLMSHIRSVHKFNPIHYTVIFFIYSSIVYIFRFAPIICITTNYMYYYIQDEDMGIPRSNKAKQRELKDVCDDEEPPRKRIRRQPLGICLLICP